MPELLFKLNGVPDDEANDIRALLEEHEIPFYETTAGRWGVSLAAIWLKDDERLTEAQDLIQDYQDQRLSQARAELEEDIQAGRQKSFIDLYRQEPLKFVTHLVIALGILYLSVQPFIEFGE